jgi:hypothetical protein
MKITQEEVSLIVDKMIDDGVKPSITRIREKMNGGDRGVIGVHLKTWREQKRKEIFNNLKVERPEELNKYIEKATDQIWNLIFKISSENIETVKTEELNERKCLDIDNKQLIESNDSYVKKHIRLKSEIIELNKIFNDKDKEISALKMKIQMLEEQSTSDNKKYFTLLDKFQNEKNRESNIKN